MEWVEILKALSPIVVALITVITDKIVSRRGTKKQIEDLGKKLDAHIKEDEDDKARQARRRILRFADECSRGDKHSLEFFDDILEDVDFYEKYTSVHPDFKNNKGKEAMARIQDIYAKCKRNNSFLK